MIQNYNVQSRIAVLILLGSLFYGQDAHAQQDSVKLQRLHGINLSIITPNVNYLYETGIGDKSVFEFSAGVQYNFMFRKHDETILGTTKETSSSEKSKEFTHSFSPYIGLGYRYYYDRDRRIRKGSNVSNNAGNYIGFRTLTGIEGWTEKNTKINGVSNSEQYFSSTFQTRNAIFWGMRRNLGHNIMYNLELGPELSYTKGKKVKIQPYLNTGFSMMF